MNREAVKNEIQNIISDLHKRIGGKAARKQYAVGKAQLVTLTELGIVDLMPEGFGHSDAKAVIEAAQDSGKFGKYDALSDDAGQYPASKLYTLLNTVEETAAIIVPDYEYEYTDEDIAELDEYVAMTDEFAAIEDAKFQAQMEAELANG